MVTRILHGKPLDSLTQKRSQVRVLFRPPFNPHIWGLSLSWAYRWGCYDSVLIRGFVSGAIGAV